MRSKAGRSFESLSLDQRLRAYRGLAEESLRKASLTDDTELHAGYLSMAAGWHSLASEIERAMERLEVMKSLWTGEKPVHKTR